MKAVLISIRPQWCELIASGKKTLEVRKSRPKLETPFKVYIYCTKDKHGWFHFGKKERLDGKIIGEFVCDNIRRFDVPYPAYQSKLDKRILEESCCTYYALHRYAYHDDLYGWPISDLKIYDKPKDLIELYMPCISPDFQYCPNCPVGGEYISEGEAEFLAIDGECSTEWYCNNRVTRPPQSWCYVEELNDGE